MMIKLFKAALMVLTITGIQALGITGASANDAGLANTSLLKYAQIPTDKNVTLFKPFKVASRRSRRRNRVIGGLLAAGVAAVIINEASRSHRRRHRHYDDDYYYSYNSYPGRRQCRKWLRRCDRGSYRSCRKWDRRCR